MDNQKAIFGLSGEMAAGKGAAAKYLMEKYDATSIRMSDALRDILTRLHIPMERANLANMSKAIRDGFGEEIFCRSIAEEINMADSPLVIIDGIRRKEEIDFFKKLQGFRFIFITSDPEIRFNRIVNRGENADDSKKTFEVFLKDQEIETESTIAPLKALADCIIDNSGTLEDLYKQLDELIAHGSQNQKI